MVVIGLIVTWLLKKKAQTLKKSTKLKAILRAETSH
jgi:hypothetical protein